MTKNTSLLLSTTPTAVVPAAVNISHVQLRDLVICPRERGLVNYVTRNSIVEQDLTVSGSSPRPIVDLPFIPNTLASLHVPGTDYTILAAGGQEAELHLSLHRQSTHQRRTGPLMWRFADRLHASINNSLMLTSLNLTRSNESSIEPRVAVSNNDCTVKFFDVPVAVRGSVLSRIKEAGSVRLNVPVNHSSISPDGSTLLSVGDSSKVFLHRISGGSRLSFSPIATLSVPPPDRSLLSLPSTSLAASFSTTFSRDGSKYAVASQEGVVCVWDVRSTKPLKVFQTDKSRLPSGSDGWGNSGTGMASGWLSDDPYEWTRGNSKAPGWSVRNVKFGSGGCNSHGKEIMTFTEHTSLLHVVDGRTFETEEIVRVPSAPKTSLPSSRTLPRRRTITGSSYRAGQTRVRSHVRPYQRPASSARALAASIVNPGSSRHIPSYLHSSRRDRESSQAPYVVLALEETFRVPVRTTESSNGSSVTAGSSTSSGWRSRLRERDADMEDLVVIPPLGDREVEDDVQALLGSHGLRARRVGSVSVGVGARGDITHDEGDPEGGLFDDPDQEEYRMEVDELEMQEPEPETEWDCVSSHAPSRSSSPGVGTGANSSAGPGGGSTGTSRWGLWSNEEMYRNATEHLVTNFDMDEDEGLMLPGQFDLEAEQESSTGLTDVGGHGKEQDLDIAGTCFDPSGGYIYVATTDSVAEWNVRGSEKRWWSDSENDWC